MLGTTIRDRLVELINPQFDDLRDKLQEEVSTKSARLALQGHLHAQGTLIAHHYAYANRLEASVAVVVDSIDKLVEAQSVAYSASTTEELK